MLKRFRKEGLSCALLLTVLFPLNVFAEEAQGAAKPAGQEETKSGEAKQEAPKKQMTKEELFSQESINKLSETYGHLIQKGLENPVLKLDFVSVIKGMQDGKAGKPAPLTEKEYEEIINQVQEHSFQDLANKNLQAAEAFLKENAKKEDVKDLEPGKLQYIVIEQGNGPVVTDDTQPMITYTGKYIDGTVFGSSDSSGGPVPIPLGQTIPGFRKGILGMKQGEKRRLFIHPELGYGVSGQLLPNALLIFEIEVTDVKPKPKETSMNDEDGDGDENQVAAAERLFPDQFEEDESDDEFDQEDSLEDLEEADAEEKEDKEEINPAS